MTGITMLMSIAAIRQQNLTSDSEIRTALMKKIKVYNYVPPAWKRRMQWQLWTNTGKQGAEKK